jgi:hypothetical protein
LIEIFAESALGQKQTFAPQKVMSALSSKADMCSAASDVCYGPILLQKSVAGFFGQ